MPEGEKMNDPEIDRILSRQDEILLSSGFVASVMEAVRSEAAAPPPIPFPWKRALLFLVIAAAALLLTLGVGIAAVAQLSSNSAPLNVATTPSFWSPLWRGEGAFVAGWTGLALLLTLISVKLSMHLAAGRT